MANNRGMEERKGLLHSIQLEQRKHAVITGVSDVCSFDEHEIVLKVDSGVMVLTGEGMHVGKLVLDEGRVDVDGHVDSIMYEAPKAAGKFFSRWRKG